MNKKILLILFITLFEVNCQPKVTHILGLSEEPLNWTIASMQASLEEDTLVGFGEKSTKVNVVLSIDVENFGGWKYVVNEVHISQTLLIENGREIALIELTPYFTGKSGNANNSPTQEIISISEEIRPLRWGENYIRIKCAQQEVNLQLLRIK